jgi:hypothetical protein
VHSYNPILHPLFLAQDNQVLASNGKAIILYSYELANSGFGATYSNLSCLPEDNMGAVELATSSRINSRMANSLHGSSKLLRTIPRPLQRLFRLQSSPPSDSTLSAFKTQTDASGIFMSTQILGKSHHHPSQLWLWCCHCQNQVHQQQTWLPLVFVAQNEQEADQIEAVPEMPGHTKWNGRSTRGTLKIASLNMNGQHSCRGQDQDLATNITANITESWYSKWNEVSCMMKEQNVGICLLQETHILGEQALELQELYRDSYHILTSHDKNEPNSKGVATILNKHLLMTDNTSVKTRDLILGWALLLSLTWANAIIHILNT